MSREILTVRTLIASLKDVKKSVNSESVISLEGCDGCYGDASSVQTLKYKRGKKVLVQRGAEADRSFTVNKLIKALSETKKQGYAEAEIIIEGCDCNADAGSCEISSSDRILLRAGSAGHVTFGDEEDDNYF
jgi:hypothetical protein